MKIGILAEKDSKIFTWSQTAAMLRAKGCELVWFEEVPTNSRKRKPGVIPARIAWRLISRIEEHVAGGGMEIYQVEDPVSLSCRFSGHFKEFAEAEIEKVRNSGVDALIRLGGRGIYRGGILTAAPQGIISIHHGDNRAFRGGPAGFWEILHKAPKTGFIVQRLGAMLDNGEVLARGEIPTAGFFALNRKQIFDAADAALANVVANLPTRQEISTQGGDSSNPGPIYPMPGLPHLVPYLWQAWILNNFSSYRFQKEGC